MLVVLDNCEQVIEAVAATVEQLLRACAGVVVLATSQSHLAWPGNLVWRVPPLSLPADADSLPLAEVANLPAVQLFVERAKLANAAFVLTPDNAPSVLKICAAVDCLPLATELAAARVRTLSVAADRRAPCRAASHALRRRAHCPRAAAHHGSGRSLELSTSNEPEKHFSRRLSVFNGAGRWKRRRASVGPVHRARRMCLACSTHSWNARSWSAAPQGDGRFRS